jgi:hypothetical protein
VPNLVAALSCSIHCLRSELVIPHRISNCMQRSSCFRRGVSTRNLLQVKGCLAVVPIPVFLRRRRTVNICTGLWRVHPQGLCGCSGGRGTRVGGTIRNPVGVVGSGWWGFPG